MKTNLRTKFEIGEIVILDRPFRNVSEVEVVDQTPQRLVTTVTADGYTWDVLTSRLSRK
jgi:hypothetical protein